MKTLNLGSAGGRSLPLRAGPAAGLGQGARWPRAGGRLPPRPPEGRPRCPAAPSRPAAGRVTCPGPHPPPPWGTALVPGRGTAGWSLFSYPSSGCCQAGDFELGFVHRTNSQLPEFPGTRDFSFLACITAFLLPFCIFFTSGFLISDTVWSSFLPCLCSFLVQTPVNLALNSTVIFFICSVLCEGFFIVVTAFLHLSRYDTEICQTS